MLGYNLTTIQTPPGGVPVRTVMVAEALDIARETYFAILMDRGFGGPVMVASPEGGVDIEAVAAKTPELIFKQPIDIKEGVRPEQTLELAKKLGFAGEKAEAASQQMQNLYKLFIKVDATQVEINPFGETKDGKGALESGVESEDIDGKGVCLCHFGFIFCGVYVSIFNILVVF